MKIANQGKALISNPFLDDPNFSRTVVLICEKDESGTLGFILNKQTKQVLNEVMEIETSKNFPIFYGGPVYTDTLYFLHQRPDIISDGLMVAKNIFWGGNFEQALANINSGLLGLNDIRFYLGYSGWSHGQLEEEIKEGSWIISDVEDKKVFQKNHETLWKDFLNEMGKEYKMMVNFPRDPKMN